MIKRLTQFICLLSLLLLTQNTLFAAIEAVQFKDQQSEQRYQKLIAEFRCLVCQNQNLADSDADLAKDLRSKTAAMLKDGKSDQQIIDYMRERYGDFVLYRPPFNRSTLLLWFGPFALLLIGIIAVLLTINRRHEEDSLPRTRAINEADRIKVRNLLQNSPDISNRFTNNNKAD